MKVSLSFATCWLAPRLSSFSVKNPSIKVKLETTTSSHAHLDQRTDIAIGYAQNNVMPDNAKLLIKDSCQAVLSPDLLKRYLGEEFIDLTQIPILSSTIDDWDWEEWGEINNCPFNSIRISNRFDTDNSAIQGAVAGLGMVLIPDFMIEREISVGSLVRLPNQQRIIFGCYYYCSPKNPRSSVSAFIKWLRTQVDKSEPEGIN